MQTPTSTVVHDIVETAAERELFVVAREMERPPYHFPEEPTVGNRLQRATRVVLEGRITPNSDGSYTVEGSEHRQYRVADSCSCPQSQKGRTRWCYHAVAVAMYLEWCKRTAPQPPLALPPVTVEERLALGMAHDSTQLAEHHTPQEDRMDDDAYIPEPDIDDAPVAVVEAPTPDPAPVPEPTRVTIPAEYVMSIKGKRHVLYAGLVIGAQRSGLVSLAADWTYNDAELSLAHAVATFADGRRYEDSGDASPSNVTKGIASHFRRVALTRAKARCLRDALGIQECSVEELEDDTPKREVPEMTRTPTQQEYRQRIWAKVQALAPEVQTRSAVEAWLKKETGYELRPDNYRDILESLEVR